MTSICPNQTALTDSDLGAIYGNGIQSGILPAEPYQQSERDGTGLLMESTLNQTIATLKSKGIIPAPPKNEEKQVEYIEKQKALLRNLHNEYCFYDARYKYSLQKLLLAIQEAYINNSTQNQQVINQYLGSTQKLNQRLNDLSQVSNAITIDMLSTTTVLKKQIVAFNRDINKKQEQLIQQNKILSSQEATTKLNKEMVKFTEQKAKYSNNLLKMYSFLNIVALGLLIYVYRSAS